jgi:hypothetical protein
MKFWVTVKFVTLVAVIPATVTVIVPVVAPAGTEVEILVAVLAVTTAVVPLNLTMLLAGVGSKFVPVIVTVVPMGPFPGVNEVMVGGEESALLQIPCPCVPAKTVVPEIASALTLNCGNDSVDQFEPLSDEKYIPLKSDPAKTLGPLATTDLRNCGAKPGNPGLVQVNPKLVDR